MDITTYSDVLDPLYGHIALDPFTAALGAQAELQRLRDVRLSNINSQLLPGSANISRFEHSLGVAYLASLAADHMRLEAVDRRLLIAAAALHDVGIPPFGHLMEEALVLSGQNFVHEARLAQIFEGEAGLGNIHFQVFRGSPVGSRAVFARREFRDDRLTTTAVFAMIRGQGLLGPLISAGLDLDNIDNVCRMAFHCGLRFRRELPIDIATSFSLRAGRVCLITERQSLVEEWLSLRSRLYSVLMTNPLDFSAKAMMIEAIRRALVQGDGKGGNVLTTDDWVLTDSELLHLLRNCEDTRELVTRLDLGDYYDLLALDWIVPESGLKLSFDGPTLDRLRHSLAAALHMQARDVLVYAIRDKRTRELALPVARPMGEFVDVVVIGRPSVRWLVGVVIAKRGVASKSLTEVCERVLNECCDGCRVIPADPREAIQPESDASGNSSPRTLF